MLSFAKIALGCCTRILIDVFCDKVTRLQKDVGNNERSGKCEMDAVTESMYQG